MNENTPLTEVAALLSLESAQLLVEVDSDDQIRVLTLVRAAIGYWETAEISLDPIQFQGALNALVATVTPLVTQARVATQQLNEVGWLLHESQELTRRRQQSRGKW